MKKNIFFIFIIFVFFIWFNGCKTSEAPLNKNLDIRGADISYLSQLEENNVKYFVNNKETNLFSILKNANVNWIRLRLWHTPIDSWNNLDDTILMAKRIKQEGLNFLLDIHYSDSWADPEKQNIPLTWQELTFDQLKIELKNYTENVLNEFNKNNCLPDMIQIGNEIENGFLFPHGKIKNGGDCSSFFELLNVPSEYIKNNYPNIKIMVHLVCNKEESKALWWLEQAKNYNLYYDIVGLSYYCFFCKEDFSTVKKHIESIYKKFNKPSLIVETSYPWTNLWNDNFHNLVGESSYKLKDYEVSPEGQKKYLKDLSNIVINSNGLGVFWWEPEIVSFNNFETDIENLSWFDFNNNYLGTSF